MSSVISGEVLAGLALSLTFGGMTFFSAVVAPMVFTKLRPDIAGSFIREVFPWYYLTMGSATLIALVFLLLSGGGRVWSAALCALALIGFLFARQVLMPMINTARDAQLAGDSLATQRFKRLHALSVVINAVQWLAILAALWPLLL